MRIEKRNIQDIKLWQILLSTTIAVTLTICIMSILLFALSYPILETLYIFFISPLTNLYEFGEVIMRASILIIIALGLIIGFRANIYNIGAEGQFIMGAICGSAVALYFHNTDGIYIIPLMIVAGIIGGIMWGIIPAFLKNYFNANEILTSLMLVYIAQLFLTYLLYGPMKDPNGMNFPQSIYFSQSAIYPYLIENTRLSITPIFLFILIPIIYLLLKKSYLGFEIKVIGYSQNASKFAGINNKKIIWISFILCGALSGLAGISETSSNVSQLALSISSGYGFMAIIVAFLGKLHPIGIIFSGFLISLIYIGSESIQIAIGLPVSVGGILQGLLFFCLLVSDFFIYYKISGFLKLTYL